MVYLRQFKELRTLNLSGNPFCSQADYKPYVIAFLSSVNFLDYRLIDEQSVSISTQLGCNDIPIYIFFYGVVFQYTQIVHLLLFSIL